MAKKNQKRRHSRTVELKRQAEQEKLTHEKGKKRLDPTARMLLYGDLVFLSVSAILETNGLISDLVSGLFTIIGIILLLLALWFQFGSKNHGAGKGPRL